ncbi:TIGR01440 family protein [Limosilactobacillus reuteri]|jgi:TIGR01440 family protein|uniref:TIGR01440 family protein n=1 Tax=Limosilactobacillus reuteri TaxID=1598 RepID=UPI000A3BA9B5|nr:TIGR01440 family protein [Limosilactobacillus reuteri]MCC4502687.1 TIGR01440 family protein [Limosilactobacillus reuteri]MCC4509574.1 TIGR01440 family protein [Limosilactobacillus reuteri]MCI7720578.1 TIGR01440 family protein [Limosilactobacillus reuteri]MDY2689899.1 TIGR01440 family protein [Limosilactobacillus reuteri]OUL52567.1 TIGR01440 family protein [Limosilactobacillus reuteri]
MTIDGINLDKIKEQTATGLTELLDQAQLEKDDLVVLGLSTSEVHGGIIGKDSNIEIARAIVSTVVNILRKHQLHLAVQGCEHLNRALVVERSVAKKRGFEQVTVFPSLHAGGAGQIAAFENFNDPIEVEHITAEAGMDIGDTSIGMHVKFVQVPVRTSIKQIGLAHTTYLRNRPKLIGGARAKYEWDPFDNK